MKVMGHQFVLGRTLDEALSNGQPLFEQGYTYSFDMLGEAARTAADAQQYFAAYLQAIEILGGKKAANSLVMRQPRRFLLSSPPYTHAMKPANVNGF